LKKADGFHLTKPLEDGNGGLRAMQRCLAQSGLSYKDIDHINCHATSTNVGDEAEAKAIANFLENDIDIMKKVSITANKSAIGHCFAAAGVIESIFTILAMENQIVPGILNLKNPIQNSKLNYVQEKTGRSQKISKVMKNSFGFGGINTALLFGKYE